MFVRVQYRIFLLSYHVSKARHFQCCWSIDAIHSHAKQWYDNKNGLNYNVMCYFIIDVFVQNDILKSSSTPVYFNSGIKWKSRGECWDNYGFSSWGYGCSSVWNITLLTKSYLGESYPIRFPEIFYAGKRSAPRWNDTARWYRCEIDSSILFAGSRCEEKSNGISEYPRNMNI